MDLTPFPQQLTAIEAPPGPTLVLAGPGAGKTFCLIRRIEYLIETLGVAADRICAVTFTNKAAEEVTARLHARLGQRADAVTRGTLHSLCLTVLRERPELAGLRRGFGVADEDYQQLLLRRLGVYPKKRRASLLTLFSRRRLQRYELTEGDEATLESYLSLLRERNLVDFDDIITLTDEVLRAHPDVAQDVAARWDAVLVDEFQDLDAAQYTIIKRLTEAHRNIFAVGDDEQSIFSWRGSDPRILWRFRTDFGLEEPIVLDRNCRCSRQIFAAARRLLRENPTLFDKQIEADRESEFEVEARGFPDEEAEADWILEDLLADRALNGKGWGDYALLYRKHSVGEYLEKRLVAAGVPCRLARGRSLLDDPIIAYVVASLRVISAPEDGVAIESFAERVLPTSMLAEVRALASATDNDFIDALRRFARRLSRDHPDSKKAWRLIYHIENLRALHESHDSLTSLVEELLSQRVRRYENRLEEHHEELEDPETYPGASDLARLIEETVARGGRILLAPAEGREIALRGMLGAVGLPVPIDYLADEVEPGTRDLVLDAGADSERPLTLALFKALQILHGRSFGETFRSYVAFDIETTDLDPGSCDIVELGAARVVDGEVVDTFQSLVRPSRPISPRATEIHGYTDADVRGAPTLEEIWSRFAEFFGGEVLVAHNGHYFDVPVLRRSVARFADTRDLVFFDTLPLARSLFRESARLADLAERFAVPSGRAHHALDDAIVLARVFTRLNDRKRLRARKSSLVNLLDHVGIGLALEPRGRLGEEEKLLLELARAYSLGRFSDCLETFAEERRKVPDAPEVEELIDRLGGPRLMETIRAERSAAERYPSALARLRYLIEASREDSLEESTMRMLERVALSTSEGIEADPHRVNLLTLHSTKGLEFSRVYIVGVEDFQIPGYYAAVDNRREEIEESRRLLYVGMTRAEDRLVLTRADRRAGRDTGGNLFLDEIGISPVRSLARSANGRI